MLTVCTSSTTENLTTLDAVKDVLGIANSTDDELLAALITRASASVEDWLGYPLRAQVYSETVSSYGTRVLQLSRTPIRTVRRAFTGTDTGTATEILSSELRVQDADAGLLSREAGFVWTAPYDHAFGSPVRVPGSETQPWMVEYTAGYICPPGSCSTEYGSTGRDLPHPFESAVLETVKTWFAGRQQDSRVRSVSVGGLSMSFTSETLGTGGLPPMATELLRRKRRLV